MELGRPSKEGLPKVLLLSVVTGSYGQEGGETDLRRVLQTTTGS